MKQFEILRAKKLFYGSSVVRKYTFKTVNTRDNYALLAKANRQLAMNFVVLGSGVSIFVRNIVLNADRPNEQDILRPMRREQSRQKLLCV